jgi:hypothetical protein
VGCDIHLFVERRKSKKAPWQMVRLPECNFGRNYQLFGMLAAVRRDGLPAIAEPRGVPEDASAEYLHAVKAWGMDGHSHSHSHHTLAQLLAYDWLASAEELEAQVGPAGFLRWLETGTPGDVLAWGRQRDSLSHEKLLALISDKAGPERPADEQEDGFATYRGTPLERDQRREAAEALEKLDPTLAVNVSWTVSRKHLAREFCSALMPRLEEIAGASGGVSNVRVVFFFDN